MEKRRIVERLIKKLNNDELSIVTEDYLTYASKVTGLHPKVLRDLEDVVFESKIESIDRSIIYDKLVHFYVVKHKIPTTYELYNYVYGLIPPYIDIGKFRKILIKMGFLWKKVSPTSIVVIENPLIRFERYNYLKRIQFYRSSNTDIYYIYSGSYDSNGNFRDPKLTNDPKVLQSNWIQKVIYAVGANGILALEEIEEFSCEIAQIWARDSLLPKIKKTSVFIITVNEHFNGKLLETPTLDSLKSDMKRWLDKHNIPYDDQMSKYELYALAEKYTNLNEHLYKVDETLKGEGHTVLRIPECIANVTSAALLARVIDANLPQKLKDDGRKSIDSVTMTKFLFDQLMVGVAEMYMAEFEKYTSKKEIELIETENKVDSVYDRLMTKASNSATQDPGLLDDSDLPSCSDSE